MHGQHINEEVVHKMIDENDNNKKTFTDNKDALSNDGKKQRKGNYRENETFAKGLKSVKHGEGEFTQLNNGLSVKGSLFISFSLLTLSHLMQSINL